ncbi:PLxRFG domain-containing protein [Acinetobacter sp. YH12211]|uniref:PLxRFG domain-containing protein n=1 Tax=Acinetobacter sp. YH12211 TaxID=2601147 RepID=UPI0015D314AA
MNIKQHFSTIAAQAAEQGKNANEVISQRERLFNEKIVPALVAKKANDVAIKQARAEWYKQTDQVMQSAGLIPKAGQSSASFEKDKRAERAIKKSAETGSKLPIIGETILSTAENIGNTFGQGVGSTIEGLAGFVRDIGENETDSIAARTAEYGKNLRKGYEASTSTMQKEIQAGGHGKIPQLASGAVQSVPAMALPMGAARGAAVGAAKLGATTAAPYIGLGVGVVAGHTQNYGEVRRNATTNLERDFPTWKHMQGNPVYEAEFNKYVQSGMDINQAKVQAHKTALDLISENAADKYGSMMTGLDFIAPSGAVLGSGILKKAPTSKIGKVLAGGGVSSELVKRQMTQPQRVGMAKLAPDLSLAANKAALGMVGKQALEEGLQGAIGEYGGQAASANIGGQSVQWGDVGKAFLEEAAIGGIMGGGMQTASRATPNDQAKSVATDLRNQTNRLRQEEAAARKELSDAIQLGDQDAINSATTNLGNIATEAAKVKSAYEQYGVDVPYFVSRFAEQAAIQPTQQDQPEQVEQSTPEQQVQPAQPQPKSVNMGMADTTNLVMDSVSKGKITPDEASEIQSNPILADVFRLSVTGDEVAAHNVVMNAVSLGNITPDQAQSMIQAIPRYKQLEKPSLSGIVNNHVQQQVQQSLQSQDDLFSGATELDPETFEPIQQEQSGIIPDDPNLTDFGYQPKQNNKPAPNDPNLRDFGIDVPEAIEPVAPVPNQTQPEEQAADFSQPKTFSNYIRANDFLKSNNLQDSHEIIKRGEGLITVRPKSIQSASPQTPVAQQAEQNQAQIEPVQPTTPDEQASVNDLASDEAIEGHLNAVPPINTPKTTPEAPQARSVEPITPEPSKEFTFAEKIKDAHINNPKIKPQLINEEVAKGRPRSEVLKEVADIVKAANAGAPSPQPTITPVEQQPLQPKNEQAKEGDIGRASDGKPFANKSAANTALKKNGLESSHAVVELAPSQFVLRKKSSSNNSINVDGQPKQDAPKQTKDPAQQALDELRAIKADDIDFSDISKAIEHYRKERDANLKVADAINDPPSVKYYKENAEQAEKLAIELEKTLKNKTESKPKGRTLLGKNKYGHEVYEDERGVRSYLDPLGVFVSESVTITPNGFEYGSGRGIEYEVFDKNEAIKSALKDYHAAKDASLVDAKDVEGRKNHYERIVRAIDKLIDVDSSNASQWNDEKQKYVNSAQRYADILAKKTETQEQDNGSTKQLDERSEGTLEGTPTEDVPRVREQGDSAAEATGSSRDDIRGSVPTGTRGADSTRSMGDDSGEVSISTRGNDSNRGLNPKQAVVADNAPVDAFVIDENEIAKGGKKTKFKANIEAIKVIKTLEAENRPATKVEQKTLSKFVGWGGLPEAFRRADGSVSTGWAKEVAELESLLTEDEYDAAVDSSIAAHYTSPEIVHSMWKALEYFGFSQGRVLEPAVGVGNFFGLMPKNMRKASRLYAVELDNITGAIAKNLYPEASIKAPMGFQDYQTIDNYFDVAIGNPPFSSNKITDLVRPAINGFNLHNYFFAKSIDSVKPNGVLAMVVTNRFLDKIGDKERAYISDRAELVGAIRLPNDAFLSNAGTQVTTDIIFLRKRAEGEAITGESWLDVKNYKDKDGNTVPLNEYFVRHPENMLGDFGAYGSMYQDGEPALIKRDGQDTQALLNEAIERLPKDIFKAEQSQDFDEVRQTVIRDISAVKVGSRFIDADGEVYERLPDVMGEQQSNKVEFANEKARSRTIGMIQTAEKLSELRTLQLDKNATNRQIEASRKELNQIYDAFVKEHGFINNRTNALLMRDDPNWAQLSALEDKYDQGVSAAVAKSTGQKFRKPSAEKAAIFTKRTQVPVSLVESVSNAQDALTESLNRHGYVNTKTMQQLYGKTEDEIIAELGELIFNDPINGYVVRDEYLSGNVKQKLAIAKESAQKNPQYQRNVQALEKVIPEDIEALDIDVKIGSHWIPEKYIADFVSHITESPNAQAEYGKYSNKWEINPTGVSVLAQSNFSTSRADTKTILTHALNGTKPTIYDRFSDGTSQINQDATLEAGERVERVKNEWKEWLWQDDTRRETLERIYNDTFNTTVNRDFDGSHLVFHGMNSAIELRPHQKNAVWRSVQSKATLYDHTVGAGKTFTVVAAAMEMRRMGIVNKPLIVVPNHLVGQWAKDFVLLYPNANILAATKRDFEKANRKRFIAKIANGDYDAIIIAHSSFGKISISPEQEQAFIDSEIAELMAFEAELKAQKGGRSRNAKDIGKRRLALEEKKKNLLNRENKDTDNIYWHELGIDSIMLDEAHEFKNLEFTTAMQNVAGLGTGKGSQKAKDLFAKIQIMQQNNPKSKIIFATGTPISNTMAEMFTMQRYLDWDGLKRQGINQFDAWAKVFGEVVSDWELSPSGKYKLTNRFAKFVNMPELMQGYLGFSDVMNRDDINAQLAKEGKTLGTPKIKGDKPQNIVVERSDAQADYIGVATIDENGNEVYPEGSLVWRTENLPRKPEKGADNMLKIMGDARKAALDMRLIDPTAEDYEGSKVNVAANNILETYKKWNAKKGTQLVFCDLSTPKGAVAKEKARIENLIKLADQGDEVAQAELDKLSPDELSALDSDFSVYDDLKAKLIAKGIKESEIAFIHDANTEEQKQKLFEAVKRGDIRVLMGSTAKMGAGMNVQNKLVALHHLDAPWRPSDLEQREGRIIRQGNEFYKADPNGFEIEINRYATKQTLDSRMWQTIESKAKFIEQVRKGTNVRAVEDIAGEAANAAEMKAASSGDPRILEEMELRKQVKDLEESKKNFDRDIHRTKNLIRTTELDIERNQRAIDRLLPDLEIKQPEKFVYSNDGKKINQEDKGAREEISKVFKTGIDSALAKGKEQSLGNINGFEIIAKPSSFAGIALIQLKGNAEAFNVDSFNIQDSSPVGLVQKILNHLKSLPLSLEAYKRSIDEAQKQLPNLRKKIENQKWERTDELNDLKQRHSDLLDELKPKKKETEAQQDEAPKMSRRASTGQGSTPEQVRSQLVNRFGDDVISQLEQNGTLNIIPSYAEKGIEGFAENGKVTLVADAITADNIVPVFLHELGGHVGMQGVLKPKAYENLMLEFDRLVKTGNPEAIEAKRLADRESDASVRADEYLPYLITVAARNQQNTNPAVRLVNRILSAVKAWVVDKLGLNLKLNPSDLVALAERMVKTVSKNPPPTPPKSRRYSKNSNPQNMSRSKQREFLDTAAKTAFGGMALRGAEGTKTLSKRTLNLFQTMLHKSLTDETGEFKKTFDLVQDKINHVTFMSAKSMDVAPSVLTQLETGEDYVKEVKRVGRALGNSLTRGALGKSKIDLDIEKVGNLMFENTLQDQSKRHSEAELRKLGFDDDQIGIYNEIRNAIDSSLDTFANTTFSNIYKHLGGTTEEVLELAAKDLDIHEHYKEIMSRVVEMVKNDPKKAEAGKAAAEGINRVYNRANELKADGYVPLMRFGKYFIRIYNPTTGEVAYRQHFESESERNIKFNEQKLDEANLPAGYVLEKSQLNELEYKLFQGVSPETVALFAKESGLPIGDAEAAYIKHSLKNNHALKRLLKRQGIKGFDVDMKRVLASFVLSNSRYSANQTYNPAIDESITEISNPAYQEDAVRLRDYTLDTQEELAGVKNFAFVYYMGFSAMFGLVNLTQPFLQTLPYLMQYSKDYGITAKSFMKAIQTWRKGTNHIEPKYRDYYERARKEGHLDPQNTWMLQGLERGKSGLGASTWQLISHSSGLFAQASETVNRRTSLFAALDVAESLGQAKLEKLGFKDAYDFAVRTIQETQGIYNKGNRPRVARGNVGSILMMYKQFMIAYIEQMVRMQKAGLSGGEDDEFKKKMAALVGFGISKSVLIAIGILFSLSGATGLPFVRDILDGIETAGGLIGKPVNTEREIQIALQDALGQTLGSTLNKALMDGFVNLQPVVDVKGRMGMGDLIPATAYFSPTTSQYQKSSEVAQIGGAIGGLIEKVRESVELAQIGSYGMAGVQLLPKAATSFGQGFVAATTGDYRNMKTGVKTNDATVLDGVIKMLDAQPAGIAEQGRIRGLEMRDRAVQQSVNSRWKERYVQALESGDRKQVMEVKQEIRDYNRDNPRYPITFNQKTAETNFNKSNQSWQEKRKNTKGLEWMDDYNPHI